MFKIEKPLAVAAAAAVFLVAYGAGFATGSADPVDVSVIHEESGEVYEVTLTRDGVTVPAGEVTEAWRGNNEAEDGLYHEDPAAELYEQVSVSITYNERGEAESVELTDAYGNDVPVGSVAESFGDHNPDEEN